jgi:hypothetical protein
MQLVKVSKSGGGGGGGSGTVTSVGLSVPSPANPAFSVSNSPIISSGTIAISANGASSQYIDGTGALQNSVAFTNVGTNIATLPNPNAIRYLRINADNSVSAISAAQLKLDIGGKQLAFKANDQNTNVLAFADVNDLSFAVVAGRTYKFTIYCQYDATNVNTGSRWAVNGPAFTRLFYNVIWTSGTGLQSNVAFQTYDATTSTLNTNFVTNNCAVIQGIVVPSANGTLTARFACELTITSITCKAGSYIEFEEI